MKPSWRTDRLRRSLNLGVSGSNTISPTAHYTGYVWARHGLGPREFATTEGAVAFWALEPVMAAARQIGQPTLAEGLVARHTAINELLRRSIESGAITQVVEIAAGLSPRGCVFGDEYGSDIVYVEADLPDMAAIKRAKLDQMGALSDHHRVVDVDALATGGPLSLGALFGSLDSTRGTAVLTEGLLPYLGEDDVRGLWRRIATEGTRFSDLSYLSDAYLGEDMSGTFERIGFSALKAFVRGGVHRHFADAATAERALHEAGFTAAQVLDPAQVVPHEPAAQRRGKPIVRVITAS